MAPEDLRVTVIDHSDPDGCQRRPLAVDRRGDPTIQDAEIADDSNGTTVCLICLEAKKYSRGHTNGKAKVEPVDNASQKPWNPKLMH